MNSQFKARNSMINAHTDNLKSLNQQRKHNSLIVRSSTPESNRNRKSIKIDRFKTQKEASRSRSSSSEKSNGSLDLLQIGGEGYVLTHYFKNLPSEEKSFIKTILRLDEDVRRDTYKLNDLIDKTERMKRKYVSAFRVRNPDLSHFKVDQIKDFTDQLMKESQNLRQPSSTILVTGGVLFIFFGTLSLSVLIARVFYDNHQIDGKTSEIYLAQAQRLMTIGFDSMIDKFASISGSVAIVLLLKPIIYGQWRTQEQTSCVYNVETISSAVIAGISSVAGASGYIEIHAAIIIGSIGGIIYLLGS